MSCDCFGTVFRQRRSIAKKLNNASVILETSGFEKLRIVNWVRSGKLLPVVCARAKDAKPMCDDEARLAFDLRRFRLRFVIRRVGRYDQAARCWYDIWYDIFVNRCQESEPDARSFSPRARRGD
jgi:hypothetical protein